MVNMGAMTPIKKDEATAARRRVPVYLVDATDGYTPETGIAAPTVEVSKNGGGQAAGTGSWSEIGDGNYYYEFAAGEVDTLGWVELRVVKAGTSREYNAVINITAYDPYESTNLGLSYLSGSVALDSTVSKAAGSKGTDDIHDTMATEANLNTKIPTALSFTGANVNSESKVTAAPTDMALNSTVAKEATLNTKIPTALGFTGANVNAESKVTAPPTDMALNSTVAKAAGTKGTDNIFDETTSHPTLAEIEASTALAKRTGAKGTDEIHDDVAAITGFALDLTVAKEATLNTKIPTALSFTGANVNSESKVTAPPTDMALNSTVAKEATLTSKADENGGRLQNIDTRLPADPADESNVLGAIATRAAPGDAMTLTGAYDAAKTAAQDGTVAKSAGAKGTDAIYDDVITHPTLAEILAGGVALEATLTPKASQASVDLKPTLAQIEASTILAKQAEVVRALGLSQENQYIDQIVYTSGKVTSMRLRSYTVAGSVGTDNDVLSTYTITANYTGDVLNWFKAVMS